MLTDLIDNQSRKAITLALKKKGNMTVDELSREVRITPMGVRQHLFVLERNGIVDYIVRKQGVGRPGFLYRLTERAENLFPNDYANLSLDLLRDIEENEGRAKIEELLRRTKDRVLSEKIKSFSGMTKLSERVSHLVDMLKEDKEIVELEEDDKQFRLKKFTCPIPRVAVKYREACASHLELYQGLLGRNVELQQTIAEGAQSCDYLIPK